MREKKKVLIVNEKRDTSIYKDLFPSSLYAPFTILDTPLQAKQRLTNEHFDLVWLHEIRQPQVAKEIAATYDTCVLLFVKPQIYDQLIYQMRDSKVFVFTYPISKAILVQIIGMIEQFMEETNRLEKKVVQMQKKLKDIKEIDRCKMELMHYFHWSEEKAHHYIEKSAMNAGLSKIQIAHTLLAKLAQKKEES